MLRLLTSRVAGRSFSLIRAPLAAGPCYHTLARRLSVFSMGSSKGKPTDPKLREEVVEGNT